MASIERTAYPRFRRLVTARELARLSPTEDELAWVKGRTRTDEHLLDLVTALKCCQRLGYFPRPEHVPAPVLAHLRRCLKLAEGTAPTSGARAAESHRKLVRERRGVVHDPERARAVAAAAIRAAAEVKNNPPDLINVALEMLVKASLELPGYSTLDELAARIRNEVNTAIFERIVARMALPDRFRLEGLLEVGGPTAKSLFNRLKQSAGRASWTAFREQVAHQSWVGSLGDTEAWLEGVAEAKIADFAGEAAAADAGVMRDVASLKRTALLACMVHAAGTRAHDDLAEMFLQADGVNHQAGPHRVRRHPGSPGRDVGAPHRPLPGGAVPPRPPQPGAAEAVEALRLARRTVEQAGGFEAELADIETVAAHHANNYMPLVSRHWRQDRATMFAFVRTVTLEATSADRSVLDAVEHATAHSHLTRDFIPGHVEGTVVDLSFASEQWQRIIRDAARPGLLNRRHFETCAFTYLAGELRTGDIAVRGSDAYANWSAQLLAWEDCEGLLGEFCAETGLPSSAVAFTEALRATLTHRAAAVDAGYPDNADLVIDEATGSGRGKRPATERTLSSRCRPSTRRGPPGRPRTRSPVRRPGLPTTIRMQR